MSFAENSPDCSSFLLKAAPVYASLRQFTPVYASLRRNSPGKLYGLINDSIMKAALRYFLIGKSRAAAVAARSAWSCDMMCVKNRCFLISRCGVIRCGAPAEKTPGVEIVRRRNVMIYNRFSDTYGA